MNNEEYKLFLEIVKFLKDGINFPIMGENGEMISYKEFLIRKTEKLINEKKEQP